MTDTFDMTGKHRTPWRIRLFVLPFIKGETVIDIHNGENTELTFKVFRGVIHVTRIVQKKAALVAALALIALALAACDDSPVAPPAEGPGCIKEHWARPNKPDTVVLVCPAHKPPPADSTCAANPKCAGGIKTDS